MSVKEFDTVVECISDFPLTHVLLAGHKLKCYAEEGNEVDTYQLFGMFWCVCVGGGPGVDESFQTNHPPNSNILIHQKVETSINFKNCVGCFGYRFHDTNSHMIWLMSLQRQLDNRGYLVQGTNQCTFAVPLILEKDLTNLNLFKACQKDHKYMKDGIVASISTISTGLPCYICSLCGEGSFMI